MTLLFRINIISKTLSSLSRLYTQSFDNRIALPPFACRQRNIFTNSSSVYFSKKKVDEVKAPRCPDFEQYFTKTKKREANKIDEKKLGKGSDDERKPVVLPSIFGDKTNARPPPRLVPEKKASAILPVKMSATQDKPSTNLTNKNEQNPKTSPDKIKPSEKAEALNEKYSLTKPLNELKKFALMPRTWDSKGSKEIGPPSQSQSIDDGKIKEESSEANERPTDGKNIEKNRKFIWLGAAAAAVLLGAGLHFSRSDPPPVNIKEELVAIKSDNEESQRPLIVPEKVPYLIIGGGAASWSAFRAIKDHVPSAKILVVSNEMHPPYKRPPLSKNLWSSETKFDEAQQQIYFEPTEFYTDPMQLFNEANGGISILTNRTAKYLNLCERKVVLTDGTKIEYEECLLAIGSKPRSLLVFQTAPLRVRNKITFLRSLNDFESAKEIVGKSQSIAVIGGGFLASEISLALTTYAASKKLNVKIYQIFHESANMAMTLPNFLSDLMKKKLTDYGLFVIPNTQVDSVHMENSKLKLGLLTGELILVDHIIVALGSQPDFAFIQMSGLKLADQNCGIAVNSSLEALPHLYVAGDAACLPGYSSKETETSYDHAIATGRIAGENMAGQKKSFAHQSMFTSNVAPEIAFQSVGRIDSTLETVGIFSNGSTLSANIDKISKGVVFYMKNDRVVGILLWNVSNKINVARQVIAEGKKLYDLNEVAKRFEIQEVDSII